MRFFEHVVSASKQHDPVPFLYTWGVPLTYVTRLAVGLILISSSVLKFHSLSLDATVFGLQAFLSPLFLLILFEFGLGLGLLFAANRLLWYTATGLFSCFAVYNAWLVSRGVAHCDCFGTVQLESSAILIVDCVVLGFLLLSLPAVLHIWPSAWSSSRHTWMRHSVLAGSILLAVVTLSAIWRFGSVSNALHWSHGDTVVVEPNVIDIGEVSHDTRREIEVSLRNIGRTPVTVHGGIPGCACTTLFSDFPISIPPGGQAQLPFTVDFTDRVLPDDIRFNISYLTSTNPVSIVITGKFMRARDAHPP